MDFSEVKTGLENGAFKLIDVRGLQEIKTDGKIPESNIVPLDELNAAFQLDWKLFAVKYGFIKPDKNCPIVISCKIGGRASRGASALTELGTFSNKISITGEISDCLVTIFS